MFLRSALCTVATLAIAVAGLTSHSARQIGQTSENTYDYIVVGSGPGGGPLAARLAEAGFSVLLIDAGGDHGDAPVVQVPALSLLSSEYPPISWHFFVSHFDDPAEAQRDSKFTWQRPDGRFFVGPNPPAGSKPLGIYYPRAGALGGCSQHNAMVTIYPHATDFSYIADITGDASWSPQNMRKMWTNIENNQYALPGIPGHGYKGYLDVSVTDLRLLLKDIKLISLVQGAATALGKGLLGGLLSTIGGLAQILVLDLNADIPNRDNIPGLYQVPTSVTLGSRARSSPRKFILDTANAVDGSGKKKYKLDIRLNTLVSRVIFDQSTSGAPRAVGVEYLAGESLYSADPRYSTTKEPSGSGSFFASKEVIISGGVYNTPQILKLSGIGPRAELEALDIPVVVDNPAVGTNLQDRYEVGVVGITNQDITILKDCTFLNTTVDPCYEQWKNNPLDRGSYSTNGFALGIVQKSSVSAPTEADLIIAGAPAAFYGYFPGYSNRTSAIPRQWTWILLKAHSRNNAGTVTLRSKDPRDVPEINFRSWARGGDADLQAMYEGVVLSRRMFERTLPLGGTWTETIPGPSIRSEQQVKEWIRNEAWGHHASCTVPIGKEGDGVSVLDSKFRVRGVQGLRVVDASVFPKIPGLYIVSAVYMISEKAAQVIIEDARAAN
ncbi:hypothetical protein BKA70DRAFT_57617 [Coprinopsis sp. MPI-PUGE-AT-0042]|nr:hypothetical protein BKA70DRAFT_57617 [Coprinopsis sp. MPI-PUGE-AT-0042]